MVIDSITRTRAANSVQDGVRPRLGKSHGHAIDLGDGGGGEWRRRAWAKDARANT